MMCYICYILRYHIAIAIRLWQKNANLAIVYRFAKVSNIANTNRKLTHLLFQIHEFLSHQRFALYAINFVFMNGIGYSVQDTTASTSPSNSDPSYDYSV